MKDGKNEVVPEEPGKTEYSIYSYEWKRSEGGRMEQSRAMECGNRKASAVVVKPRYIYTLVPNVSPSTVLAHNLHLANLRTKNVPLNNPPGP